MMCISRHAGIAFLDMQDKINSFWEITKKELDDKKAEARNKDREMEEMEERHQVEIKVRSWAQQQSPVRWRQLHLKYKGSTTVAASR